MSWKYYKQLFHSEAIANMVEWATWQERAGDLDNPKPYHGSVVGGDRDGNHFCDSRNPETISHSPE